MASSKYSGFLRLSNLGIGWIALFTISACPPASAAATREPAVKAYEGKIEIPTYPWWPPVRHPYFRATDGRNIYPYPMLDDLKREKEPRTWRTVVLENEYLRITFLPELGGKVYEVMDKTISKPMFYTNHVVKPGLIGQCGAWVSGGIEFNTGPQGHTVSAVLPVDVEILPATRDGSRSVAVGEVEKIYRTRWTVVVTLRPGRSFIEERIRIYNPTDSVRPYYFWNCTAVPNTPGFRFVYPMTLGTDHGGKVFYTWPVSDGKDLSLGRSYQDASSIFAYECDQDFFGSYDEDADRGVVAYANHHILPGKKAWTWGQGSYGRMHQMDLTDDDGPYNEVQTGPLPTQADVGRLEPCEAVAWEEWWYPVHGIGGFTFATRDVAVNAKAEGTGLRLRMVGTGTWNTVDVRLSRGGNLLSSGRSRISPRDPSILDIPYPEPSEPVEVEIVAPPRERPPGSGKKAAEAPAAPSLPRVLARFRVPLDLPVRKPPKPIEKSETATDLSQAGWSDYLFARTSEAETRFRKALEKDPRSTAARTGLAFLSLEGDPRSAAEECRSALAVDPDLGLARFALASAEFRLGELTAALDDAWKASLDPLTAVPGRALAAKVRIRRKEWDRAQGALASNGPWLNDPLCRALRAFASFRAGQGSAAAQLAQQNLALDPLDAFSRTIAWLASEKKEDQTLDHLIGRKAQAVLDLAALYGELGEDEIALGILRDFYMKGLGEKDRDPIPFYWAAYLSGKLGKKEEAASLLRAAREIPAENVFPHRAETAPILRWALAEDPEDGKAALYLGHLLFHLGRPAEARAAWRKAAERGAEPAIAYRALGMAALKLDGDLPGAAELFGKAHEADPCDPIVAMDLARALFSLAEKDGSDEKKRELTGRAKQVLASAFEGGKGRSDFVALLARAQNRLGDFAGTAKLLDSVRITIWEGAREAHDLFEEAHLELGKAHLEAGRSSAALAEFDRALEYPENLATGKLEDAREGHIQLLRGKALEALGRKDRAREAYGKAAGEPPSKDPRKEEARKMAREALEKLGKEEKGF